MKNKYTSPEIEVVDLEIEDITNENMGSIVNGEQDNNSGDIADMP
ncbi:MAG: hypothetical protein U0K54_06285 [Acutalibacteraceae bacterium]|nr:hypothetical protein [Acutalibacteraceae bacterium]